jgi:hypothetical protein
MKKRKKERKQREEQAFFLFPLAHPPRHLASFFPPLSFLSAKTKKTRGASSSLFFASLLAGDHGGQVEQVGRDVVPRRVAQVLDQAVDGPRARDERLHAKADKCDLF